LQQAPLFLAGGAVFVFCPLFFVNVVITVLKGTLGANDEEVWQKDKFFC